jgi:hypothetical protein
VPLDPEPSPADRAPRRSGFQIPPTECGGIRDGRSDQDHLKVGSFVRLPHQPVVFEDLSNVLPSDRVSLEFDDVLNPIHLKEKVDASAFYKDLATFSSDDLVWEKNIRFFEQIVVQVTFKHRITLQQRKIQR